jgi:hypothetical protein
VARLLAVLLLVAAAATAVAAGLAGATTRPAPPAKAFALRIAGPPQTVLSYARQRCDDTDFPDLPVRAFRTSDGRVVLYYGSSYGARALVGPDLDHLRRRCTPIFSSRWNSDPSRYAMGEWLAGGYTEDGSTIYSLVHEEYHGEGSGLCAPPAPFPGDWQNCWMSSITEAVSTDGGRSFHPIPGRPVAAIPYTFAQFRGSSLFPGPIGYTDPSNIIKKDGDYYAFVQLFKLPQWVGACLIRTHDLAQPGSWRAWDGHGFNLQFDDPYTAAVAAPPEHVCQPVAYPEIERMHNSITYNTVLKQYVLVGTAMQQVGQRTVTGIYYSFSRDLVNWTPRRLLFENPLIWGTSCDSATPSVHYPSLIDPASPTRNFETTGARAYLYLTRFHPKLVNGVCQRTLDRDLIRIPITVAAG